MLALPEVDTRGGVAVTVQEVVDVVLVAVSAKTRITKTPDL